MGLKNLNLPISLSFVEVPEVFVVVVFHLVDDCTGCQHTGCLPALCPTLCPTPCPTPCPLMCPPDVQRTLSY